jgi:hypothetical protein
MEDPMPFHSDIQPHLYPFKEGVGVAAVVVALLLGWAWNRKPSATQ